MLWTNSSREHTADSARTAMPTTGAVAVRAVLRSDFDRFICPPPGGRRDQCPAQLS